MASKINADEFVDREGEGKPTLPKGVVLSGVTTITTAVVAENEVANSTGINVGIITSTHFAGNLTGDVNAGIVTVTSQSVIGSAVTISASGIDIGAGVITATSYAGSGANLTGLGATIMIWEYTPDPYVDEVAVDAGIGITFNQKIKAGSGNVTLRIAGAAGTVVENFGVGSSVTIAGNSLSFTPTSDLDQNVTYFVDIPSGSITNMAGDSYVGTGYTFQTTYVLNELWTVGENLTGGLGLNQSPSTRDALSSPTQIPGGTWKYFRQASGMGNDQAVIKTDGTLWAWGQNNNGQLGQNSTVDYSSPVQIPGDWTLYNNARTSFAGGSNMRIIKSDGTLWAWGFGGTGSNGDGTTTQRSSPIQIGSDTTWSAITGNYRTNLALKTDGTLWSWGNNEEGSLGHNNKTDYSSPRQVGSDTTWAKLGICPDLASAAIKTDGTLWTWGDNDTGMLGLNNQTDYSSPKQVPGTTWANIMIDYQRDAAMATKTDGTLWMWGSNGRGQLGLNNGSQYSSPKQVHGNATTWSTDFGAFIVSNWSSHALKTDGTLWGWGDNRNGQLGQNSTAAPGNYYSSPIQITGTTWNQIGGNKGNKFFGKDTPSSA